MKEDDNSLKRFLEGGLLLSASILSLIPGIGFFFAVEAMLDSRLNFFLGANETSASAIGLIFIAAGIYWFMVAARLFRGDRAPLADLRCFFGGNGLLILSVFSFASAIAGFFMGYDQFASQEEYFIGEDDFHEYEKVAPVIGLISMAAGLYWFWSAAELLRGNRRSIEDLRCFLAGHILLFAGLFSVITGVVGFVIGFPAIGLVFFAVGIYWSWTAIRLLRGDQKPLEDMRCFIGGQTLLVAGAFSILMGITAFLETSDDAGFNYSAGTLFILAGSYWILVSSKLLRGNRGSIANLGRFLGGNVLFITGVFGALMGVGALFLNDGEIPIVIAILVGIFFIAMGALLVWGAFKLLRGQANSQQVPTSKSQVSPKNKKSPEEDR